MKPRKPQPRWNHRPRPKTDIIARAAQRAVQKRTQQDNKHDSH